MPVRRELAMGKARARYNRLDALPWVPATGISQGISFCKLVSPHRLPEALPPELDAPLGAVFAKCHSRQPDQALWSGVPAIRLFPLGNYERESPQKIKSVYLRSSSLSSNEVFERYHSRTGFLKSETNKNEKKE